MYIILLMLINFSFAKPSQVIIIRHAEKPDIKSDNLSDKGFERAQKLSGLFSNQPQLATFGLPVALFATSYIPGESSQRTIQTLTPLSQVLNIPIQSEIATDDYKLLAQKILNDHQYDGHSVMIAWTHSNIVGLANALGSAPYEHWDANVFDRIWLLTFQDNGNVTSADLPQNLMPGDSN